MIYSDDDYHEREAMRQLIHSCLSHLSSSTTGTDMLQRGIRLIGIMLQHESDIHTGQRQRLVDIKQIASELQEVDQSFVSTYNNDFTEMAGALDLDMLLQPFGETYAPYFSQVDGFS